MRFERVKFIFECFLIVRAFKITRKSLHTFLVEYQKNTLSFFKILISQDQTSF